jgi:hypothetical protein
LFDERCMFVAGLLCLRDHAAGGVAGQDIWREIAPLLFRTLSPLQQQQPSESAPPTQKKRASIILGHGLLHSAAHATQQQRVAVLKVLLLPLHVFAKCITDFPFRSPLPPPRPTCSRAAPWLMK